MIMSMTAMNDANADQWLGFITTATHCKPPNTQSYLCTSQCVDQWVHVVSKKIQVGCDQTNNLQTNTSQSLTVTCAGRQQSSDMCSYGCLEHVTYSGSYTTVTLESECIDGMCWLFTFFKNHYDDDDNVNDDDDNDDRICRADM